MRIYMRPAENSWGVEEPVRKEEAEGMKKILIPLLVLLLICTGLSAGAEGNEELRLEVNTAKLPVYESSDPFLNGLVSENTEELPVLVIPVKKIFRIPVSVMPKSVKNKKVTLTAENPEILKVNSNGVTGQKKGETLLTIASAEDPAVMIRYRVAVIQPVTRISVTASEKSVAAGGTVTLTAAFAPEDASIQRVRWISSNEKAATVDENGTVTGVARGNARISAIAEDGSNIRANISIQVIQNPETVQLDKAEATVDVGKTGTLKATVLPKTANDKNVVWTSSDESIATVNASGRITGLKLGECEIICTSRANGEAVAKATVHVQQPVKKVTFGEAPTVYVNETGKLTWNTEPADATNPALTFRSVNEKVLTVSEDGTVTGVKAGEATVIAMTTDGSNRQARIKVRVYQHVTGVHMKRKTAYIDLGATSSAGAILEPANATNHNMTWETADASIAKAEPVAKQKNRVNITGVSAGETTVTGTTEDGGFKASILVKVGDWEKALKITEAKVQGADALVTLKNTSELTITSVTVEVSVLDNEGKPVPCNKKDNSNTFQMVYKKTLEPGASTKEKEWKIVNYKLPESTTVHEYVVKVTEFEIDHDWIKLIRKRNQPTKKCPVHL